MDPDFLRKASAGQPLPTTSGGASGYFSPPSDTLDPNLFDGNNLRPEVRNHVIHSLIGWFHDQGYTIDLSWIHIWIAGSGVTYQWSASRGNGDLDVLFSVDVTPFEGANPGRWGGRSEADLAAGLSEDLKRTLWPDEARTRFGNQVYEVTYYFNPGTGKDIRNIHPYAAFDVLADRFSVPPPRLPADPRSLYPDSWYEAVGRDHEAAQGLSDAYAANLSALSSERPGSVEHHRAGAKLNLVVQQATTLFNEIHLGRRDAFGPQGHGYGDYTNFRWQSAKESGAVQALHAIVAVGTAAREAEETERYGAPIEAADVVLRRAAAQYRNRT